MSLFCINGQRLKFDIVGLDDNVFRKIKMIVLENGGIIEQNNHQIIKFTEEEEFVTYAYPSYQLYNIKFIEDCVKKGTIVNPSPYKIGSRMLYDDCMIRHFLTSCNCCDKPLGMDVVETDDRRSINSNDSPTDEQRSSQSESDGSDNTVINPILHCQTSLRPIKNGNQLNKNDDSEDETDTAPRGHSKSSKSRQNRATRHNKRGRGQQFTQAEDKAIVKYLVDNRVIGEVENGLGVWSILIESGICPNRTPNSLYRHFRRYILPSIESYNLTEKQLQRFKRLFKYT